MNKIRIKNTKPNSNIVGAGPVSAQNSKGITLVALIITIIVMLILAGVSIAIAINGGLFDTTKRAARGTKAEIEAEQELSNGRVKVDGKWYDSIEDYVGGKESTDQTDPERPVEPETPEEPDEPVTPPETPVVGDYINYEPDTVSTKYKLLGIQSGYGDYDSSTTPYTLKTAKDQEIGQDMLTWQVLKVHSDGTIDLIGTPTNTAVYFQGALGYNNGVLLMHEICETLYSKPSKGITARSVSLEDFEDEDNGGAWKTARNSYTGGSGYGSPKEYTNTYYCYYPNLYAQENGSGINTSTVKTDGIKNTNKYYTSPTTDEFSQTSSKLTVTQTYYNIAINEANYGKSASVLYNTTTYWVASRFIYTGGTAALFGLRSTDYGFNLTYIFDSSTQGYDHGYRFRPIVSLGSSVQYNKVSETDGVKTFDITKY